ncbi:hypothetical protein GALMADRAFT_455272 [Galerina marginata CBS 339.88]|uniref:Uncharacterized protein n=1 Tax=Galerina marginata (strain CBS 339.88) TaxID=685588 RepID=A0A067TAB5_GALM3|nr:hypothetical protein GALMADRAFT_455272 [Galerina marginata CBS 339.88]
MLGLPPSTPAVPASAYLATKLNPKSTLKLARIVPSSSPRTHPYHFADLLRSGGGCRISNLSPPHLLVRRRRSPPAAASPSLSPPFLLVSRPSSPRHAALLLLMHRSLRSQGQSKPHASSAPRALEYVHENYLLEAYGRVFVTFAGWTFGGGGVRWAAGRRVGRELAMIGEEDWMAFGWNTPL